MIKKKKKNNKIRNQKQNKTVKSYPKNKNKIKR